MKRGATKPHVASGHVTRLCPPPHEPEHGHYSRHLVHDHGVKGRQGAEPHAHQQGEREGEAAQVRAEGVQAAEQVAGEEVAEHGDGEGA